MSWSDIAPAPNVAGTHSYLAVRSPWGRPSAFVPPSPNSRSSATTSSSRCAAEQRKALEKRGAVQARDRIRSATARKFTQQIIDTIMVNS